MNMQFLKRSPIKCCPLCGGDAILGRSADGKVDTWSMSCTKCGLLLRVDNSENLPPSKIEKLTVDKWNKRI